MLRKNQNNCGQTRKLLVIRLSAIGDVVMTVPALWSIAYDHPSVKLTVVSQEFARDIMAQIPGVIFCPADLKNRHKGLAGLIRLYRDLQRLGSYDYVVDLHSVLRSWVLSALFWLHGVKCVRINKGRDEKRQLVRAKHKILKQLPSTFERYANTFQRIGINVGNRFIYFYEQYPLPQHITNLTGLKNNHWIGIAPFAKHKGKIYPIELMELLVADFSRDGRYTVFLFGSGGLEKRLLESWEDKYVRVKSLARRLSLSDELKVMSNLEALVCMDSANMHLASLVNTPVVSIWGATHPFAGFYGWRQQPENAIQLEMPCRPCSIYGNKPCLRGDYACLRNITPEMIAKRVRMIVERT